MKKGPNVAINRVCAFIGEPPGRIVTFDSVIKMQVREGFQESK